MIYYQKTMVTINMPEEGEFRWYWISDGIRTKKEDKHSEKQYVWSDEELESFRCPVDKDDFLEKVRAGKFEFFSIKKKLFSGREYLEHNLYGSEYETWYLDEIDRVDVKFCYYKEQMTLDKARNYLDVEEYAKMVKSLGLKE